MSSSTSSRTQNERYVAQKETSDNWLHGYNSAYNEPTPPHTVQRRSSKNDYQLSTLHTHHAHISIPHFTYSNRPRSNPSKLISLNDGSLLGTDSLGLVVHLHVLLASHVHGRRKGLVRLPLAGCAGSSLLQHLVDLLEGEALGLGDEEVGKED
jgi:hypothetical protein